MKRFTILLLASFILPNIMFSQELVFTAPGGKQAKLVISTSQIIDNRFTMNLQVIWTDRNFKPIDDPSSVIVFDKNAVNFPDGGFFRCLTFEQDPQPILYFNKSLTLNFLVDDNFNQEGIAQNFFFPFYFASEVAKAMDRNSWQPFLFQSPKKFFATVHISPNQVRDITPPRITILSPEGIEDGFRPTITQSEIEVKLAATDRSGIKEITVNGSKSVRLNDSTFVAKVKFSRIGGSYPIKILAIDNSENQTTRDFFVDSKDPSKTGGPLLAATSVIMISDVDTLIPVNPKKFPNRYALIIGNEDYKSHQKDLNYESNVEFARRDAEVFREYAEKTLGIPSANIIYMTDAKAIEMHRGINQLNSLLKATRGNGEAFVFFAGHGFPDEKSREGHLIPVDVSGNDLEFAIKLKDFYAKLYEHPSKGVTVFLDACFSGGGREEGLLAARAVRVRPKEEYVRGNMVVFTASAGNESALPLRSKFHGLFTYYLLKALQESEGRISYGDLSEYIISKVSTSAVIHNNKEQNPTIAASSELGDNWKQRMIVE